MNVVPMLVASALGAAPLATGQLCDSCPPLCAPDAPYNVLCGYFVIPDEGFEEQWYIEAVRACEAWGEGVTGDGVMVAVIDYGVLPGHPDLVNQVDPAEPRGCSEVPPDPLPPFAARYAHGTMMAGVIAAEAGNVTGLCSNTTGIAFDARIAEVFLWNGTEIDDVEIAHALGFRNDCIDVKTNSYDISGLTAVFAYVDDLHVLPALSDGVEQGRAGLGQVYVFSAGNEGEPEVLARTDYDELVSSRFTIAVGAISPNYTIWSDSEGGSSLFCSGPGDKMFMPSRASSTNFDPDYTCASGTSFSTPVVAAVIALMMEANTNLAWRDVMEAIVQTAATIDPGPGWKSNQAGFDHSYEYGHGLIDAYEAVSFVTGTNGFPAWAPLLGEREVDLPLAPNSVQIAPGQTRTLTVEATANMRIEHVELLMNITTSGAPGIGPLKIWVDREWPSFLDGPQLLTRSTFTEPRADPSSSYDDALFTSVRHWGETGTATWNVYVRNTSTGDDPVTATWNAAELRFYGTPECVADWNLNGVGSEQADWNDYMALYNAQDPLADLTGDRIVDGSDLAEFVGQFAAGCP